MIISCEKCFFAKENQCRVNPPDPLLEKLFPSLAKDLYPCAEYLDKESGFPIDEIIKRQASKRRNASYHPAKPEIGKP